MPSIAAYHRPDSLDEALSLLAQPQTRALAGGTVVVPESRVSRPDPVELVDLQALGLDGLETAGDRVTIGAMVRLGDLMADAQAPELLRELAKRELPSALRNQATVGGTVALAESESVLLAGLLAHDATVRFHDGDDRPLTDVLSQGLGAGLVTSISVAAGGAGAIAATGRTPADVPIVAAVARWTDDGVALALTGVADTPVLADPAAPTSGLSPAGDFRGSPDYRLHLVDVLSRRAIEEVSS